MKIPRETLNCFNGIEKWRTIIEKKCKNENTLSYLLFVNSLYFKYTKKVKFSKNYIEKQVYGKHNQFYK